MSYDPATFDDAGPLNTFNGWTMDADLYRSAARAADMASLDDDE